MPYLSRYESPLGAMTMASDGERLTGLWFDGQKYDRSTISDDALLHPHLPIFTQTAQWLDAYFEGAAPGFTPPIRVEGSDFKKTVTSIMLSIPFGATSTYARIAAEVARRMGRKQMSAQAVGGAVGRNPIVLIVPCHRVLASDGSLRGYAGGVDRKERLLEMEGSTCPVCQRHLPLTTAVEGQNEKADRGPEQALENPGDRPDGEMQPIRQHVVRHMNSSVHADSRPGRPGDHSNNQCCHCKSARQGEIREVLEEILLTSLG